MLNEVGIPNMIEVYSFIKGYRALWEIQSLVQGLPACTEKMRTVPQGRGTGPDREIRIEEAAEMLRPLEWHPKSLLQRCMFS